jgi:hypothetical protein
MGMSVKKANAMARTHQFHKKFHPTNGAFLRMQDASFGRKLA